MVLGPSAVMLTVALLFNPFEMSTGENVNLLRQHLNCCFLTMCNKTAFTFNNPLVKVLGT